jgi:hypothetical protein
LRVSGLVWTCTLAEIKRQRREYNRDTDNDNSQRNRQTNSGSNATEALVHPELVVVVAACSLRAAVSAFSRMTHDCAHRQEDTLRCFIR